jgi:hypothetical protein
MHTPHTREKIKPLLIYTMTSGLGDFLVLGDLIRKIEKAHPSARCLIVHRGNPHIRLWPNQDRDGKFFSIYSIRESLQFLKLISLCKSNGYTIFGLQMAPGSIQGFSLYFLLKKSRLIDYIVDFNLINADIVTPPKGNYILDLHLNQAAELFGIDFPPAFYNLELPVARPVRGGGGTRQERLTIGFHPWSRRGNLRNFVWPYEKWLELFENILSKFHNSQLIVFGRDKGFFKMKDLVKKNLQPFDKNIIFSYSHTVTELIDTIASLDSLVTVNTSVVHIGYALAKQMFILNGPSLDLWVPKADNIFTIKDRYGIFQASDRCEEDSRFGSIDRIEGRDLFRLMEKYLPQPLKE